MTVRKSYRRDCHARLTLPLHYDLYFPCCILARFPPSRPDSRLAHPDDSFIVFIREQFKRVSQMNSAGTTKPTLCLSRCQTKGLLEKLSSFGHFILLVG
jgi:hypothetical protein